MSLGNSVLRREGWKTSLTILFTIIAVSIGGIGIAGMGSAIGLPAAALAAILGTLGFGLGQEIDVVRSSGEPDGAARSESGHGPDEGKDVTDFSLIDATPTPSEPSLNPHLALTLQILSSLDEAFTPISVAVNDSNNELKKLADLLDKSHSLSESTHTTSVELRDRLFPELDRIARTIEAQSIFYREASIEQTKAIHRLATIGLAALLVLTVGFLALAYLVVMGVHMSH